MSLVILVNEKLVGYCTKHDLKIEECCICIMVSTDITLLESYFKAASEDQIKVRMQPLVRKNLLSLREGDFKLENYEVTPYGGKICAQIQGEERLVDFVDLVGRPSNNVTEQKTEMDLFIDSYLELFPKGIKNGGNKPLRSNATDVKAKMLKFMNKYHHTKDIILKATKNYMERLRGIYTYCPTSEYFIMKDGSSALATECDMVRNGLGNEDIINPFQKHM